MLFRSSNTRRFACIIFLKTDTICFHCYYMVYSTAFLGFFISYFIWFYSFNIKLFTEINSAWLICETIKALEIKNWLHLAQCLLTTLFYHTCSYFFVMIDLLRGPRGPPTNEAQVLIKTSKLKAEIEKRKFSK